MALGIGMSDLLTAYDIDGVLVPDCDHFPNIGGLDEFYEIAAKMLPIFHPAGDFILITARPKEYSNVTWKWCGDYMDPLPISLFHGCQKEPPHRYKTGVLNANPHIKRYIESDLLIVDYLKLHVTTGCEIVHFKTFMQGILK